MKDYLVAHAHFESRRLAQLVGIGLLGALLVISLLAQPKTAPKALATEKTADPETHNKLTKAEKAAGWRLLFDGKTTNGWRGFHQEGFPKAGWVVEDGNIKHLAAKGQMGERGGDIITVDKFDNFEFQIEWRISPGGNSGIKYLISEDLPKTGQSGVSFEYQLIDDGQHPDSKMVNRRTGALYDLIAPQNKVLKPVGEYNLTKIVIHGKHIEHWLNGVKLLEFERESDQLKALIAASKYKEIAGFGQTAKGHILLQDHGDEVWFRNIKLRELPAK